MAPFWRALIGYLLIPAFGWQVAFLVGAIPALYVFILRRAMPRIAALPAEHGARRRGRSRDATDRSVGRREGG